MASNKTKTKLIADRKEKETVSYFMPSSKAHIPKHTPVKMKILFCSKSIKGLSVPVYKS